MRFRDGRGNGEGQGRRRGEREVDDRQGGINTCRHTGPDASRWSRIMKLWRTKLTRRCAETCCAPVPDPAAQKFAVYQTHAPRAPNVHQGSGDTRRLRLFVLYIFPHGSQSTFTSLAQPHTGDPVCSFICCTKLTGLSAEICRAPNLHHPSRSGGTRWLCLLVPGRPATGWVCHAAYGLWRRVTPTAPGAEFERTTDDQTT